MYGNSEKYGGHDWSASMTPFDLFGPSSVAYRRGRRRRFHFKSFWLTDLDFQGVMRQTWCNVDASLSTSSLLSSISACASSLLS
ncbi:hypothetical protein ACOSP7_015301 [Xanthoceras sorbifolium]